MGRAAMLRIGHRLRVHPRAIGRVERPLDDRAGYDDERAGEVGLAGLDVHQEIGGVASHVECAAGVDVAVAVASGEDVADPANVTA